MASAALPDQSTTISISREGDPSSGSVEEHRIKRDRMLKIMADHGAKRLLLTSQPTLAWYLDGARIHVSLAAPPIVAMIISPEVDELIATSNEVDRLRAEELPSWVQIRAVNWQLSPAVVGSEDADLLVEDAIAAELRDARTPLLPSEADRFRALGQETARLLTDLLTRVRPEQSETEVAAAVTSGIAALGAEPLVVLVGGAARLAHRHPLPGSGVLGRRVLVVVCARRHGLVINVSRWVRFGSAQPGEDDADQRILNVEAAFFDAVRPGHSLGEVLDAGRGGYEQHGFGPEEWIRHHQGGVAGYAGRDPRATEGATDLIRTGQAFAWNPSAPGCKVEDTVLLTEDGLEVLTVDSRWPSVECAGRRRPAVLELPG